MNKQLILIPTPIERLQLHQLFASQSDTSIVELCGFGPIVSAARAAQLICQWQPRSVLLVGIAGALDARLNVGQAYEFSEVACYGIGAGNGSTYQTPADLGWQLWPPPPSIGDRIELATSASVSNEATRQLLTVCSAATSPVDVAQRLTKYPAAQAEDMEGFAVALACQLAGVPLRIVRGISNVAGDREKSNWRIEQALHAAGQLAMQVLNP